MNIEATIYIIRRCITLLQRKSGTNKTKQEYHYWIIWLKKQLQYYNRLEIDIKNNIKKIILQNKYLKEDLDIKL